MARGDTKQSALLSLLNCARGTTIREMTDVTGWRANTVHSALATLRKRGWQISVEQIAAEKRYQITAGPETKAAASEQPRPGA
jgi:DNA-binding IclR family transcriptional regulator